MLKAAGRSDTGRKRRCNEDVLLLAPEIGLLAVCDGANGDAAAHLTAESLLETVRAEPAGDPAALLERAVHTAAARVRERWDEEFSATATVGAVLCTAAGVAAMSVGDTRCYWLRGGVLRHLTGRAVAPAHEAHLRGQAAQYARAGAARPVPFVTPRWGNAVPYLDEVQLAAVSPQPADVGLLCSDGLLDDVSEEEVARLLGAHADPTHAAAALVEAALAAGGRDNVSVIVFTP